MLEFQVQIKRIRGMLLQAFGRGGRELFAIETEICRGVRSKASFSQKFIGVLLLKMYELSRLRIRDFSVRTTVSGVSEIFYCFSDRWAINEGGG